MGADEGYKYGRTNEACGKIYPYESGMSATLERTTRGHWKLDFNIGSESVFLSLCVLFLIFTLMLLLGSGVEAIMGETLYPWWGFVIPLAVSAFFYLLKKKRDDFYIIDPELSQLRLSREFFGRKEKVAAVLGDIFAVSVQGMLYHGRGVRWWLYHLVVILKKGGIIRMSNDFHESVRGINMKLGEELAGILNVPFIETPLKTRLAAGGPVSDRSDIRQMDEKEMHRRFLILIGIIVAVTMTVIIGTVSLLTVLLG